jgi:hypothetical protein
MLSTINKILIDKLSIRSFWESLRKVPGFGMFQLPHELDHTSRSTSQTAYACKPAYGVDVYVSNCVLYVVGQYKSAGNGYCTHWDAGKYGVATGQTTGSSWMDCTHNSNSPSQSTAQTVYTCNAGYSGGMPLQEEHAQRVKPASTNEIRYSDSVKQVNTQISPEGRIASMVVQGITEYKLVLLVNPLASTAHQTGIQCLHSTV